MVEVVRAGAARCEPLLLTTRYLMDKSTRLDGRLASGQRFSHPESKVIQRAKFRSEVVRKSPQPKNLERKAQSRALPLKSRCPDYMPTRIAASARHSCGPLRKVHASLRALKQAKDRWPEGSDRLYYLQNKATSGHSSVYHTITARNHGLKAERACRQFLLCSHCRICVQCWIRSNAPDCKHASMYCRSA